MAILIRGRRRCRRARGVRGGDASHVIGGQPGQRAKRQRRSGERQAFQGLRASPRLLWGHSFGAIGGRLR